MASESINTSNEHDDALMLIVEGMRKSIEFMQNIIIEEQPTDMWWA